jgi:DDE family transposase
MNRDELYRWAAEIASHFGRLSKPQVFNLAAFSRGVIEARDCRLALVAEALGVMGQASSVERRLQRFLANPHLTAAKAQRDWASWVLGGLDSETLVLLVDETKLGVHLGTMMVGVAYRQRCIPLVWRCYRANSSSDYPPEGQVALIAALLQRVADALPAGVKVCVQADQGLGTSPDLMRAVLALGWDYLFRIQGSSHVLLDGGNDREVRSLIERGECRTLSGRLFKGDGWQLPSHLHLIWDEAYEEAWYLASNAPDGQGRDYAQRNWQEQGFRDLKSGGWKWDDSQVWQPDHAERLILVLALAYTWMLSYGTLAFEQHPPTPPHGQRLYPRLSLFRLGLRAFKDALRRSQPLFFAFHFVPFPPPLHPQAIL